jgi:pantoate--beta-alanine ligase
MKIIRKNSELLDEVALLKKEKQTIGFVPTMGALHEGHLRLVTQSVSENKNTIVSIFVNPTQFNNPTDLEKYPRKLEEDALLLEKTGCSILFAPETSEMYTENELIETFNFDFGGLDKVMEGKFRPGHFNGVVQVVNKLFRLTQPSRAYFGEKDFQQLAIIHRMVDVFKIDIEIIDCPIIREESGLALSSRNERLSPQERKNAIQISKVLFESRNFADQLSPDELTDWVTTSINAVDDLEVEYFEIVDVKSLQKVSSWGNETVGCIAVFCGEVRLIDNIRY